MYFAVNARRYIQQQAAIYGVEVFSGKFILFWGGEKIANSSLIWDSRPGAFSLLDYNLHQTSFPPTWMFLIADDVENAFLLFANEFPSCFRLMFASVIEHFAHLPNMAMTTFLPVACNWISWRQDWWSWFSSAIRTYTWERAENSLIMHRMLCGFYRSKSIFWWGTSERSSLADEKTKQKFFGIDWKLNRMTLCLSLLITMAP